MAYKVSTQNRYMKIGSILTPQPSKDPNASKTHWVEFHSETLNERFQVIYDKRHLPEARATHPTLAVYFSQEIRELRRMNLSDTELKAIHFWKKGTKGWIIPKSIMRKDGLVMLPK